MASPRCKNASTKFWKTLESKAFSEIFGLSRMWNNFLAEIVKYCSRRSQCEMKFAHIRVSEYFTFAEQIFHSEAISLAQRANFVEKSTCVSKCFFLWRVSDLDATAVCIQFRCTLILQRVHYPLGDDGSCTWPLSSGAKRHACNESYVSNFPI